jgi:hypothetical protein
MIGCDVHLAVRLAFNWLRRDSAASDQTKSLGPSVESMPFQDPPDPVRRNPQAAPLRSGQLRGDPRGTKTRMPERKANDSVLDQDRNGVGHPRLAPFPRAEDLHPEAHHLTVPAVVRGVMNAERSAGSLDTPELLSEGEDPDAKAVEAIIVGQDGAPLLRRLQSTQKDAPLALSGDRRRYYSGIVQPSRLLETLPERLYIVAAGARKAAWW